VSTSINSITTPGVWFGSAEESRRIARECNEYAARLAQDYPGRYGSFAALPMLDTDGALKEIEYALDTLKADGVCLFTNYGDTWLGDKRFAPVLEELNRRKAVIYTHPIAANCCRNLVPDVPDTVIEYGTDTTRTITSLLFSGTASRLQDMRLIFSHAGGTMPFLIERLTLAPRTSPFLNERMPNGALHELRRFFYDTAQTAHPNALFPLLHTVSAAQVLFGTDYPFRTSEDHVRGLMAYGFGAEDLTAIERGNALRLLPRLKD
jgi:predicted TIM-barrel fold metal-dependent hydrolase